MSMSSLLLRTLTLIFALSVVVHLFGAGAAARAEVLGGDSSRDGATTQDKAPCSAPEIVQHALVQATTAMQDARYTDAVNYLQAIGILDCSPKVDLLLAAAYEGSGSVSEAIQVLQRAHERWPTNNSLATSLARDFLATGETVKAGDALAFFRPDAPASSQELEIAVVALLANHKLVPAREAASAAYTKTPSLRTLLLLANALQLEGRYKEVVALMQNQRATYAESAPFLVTIAESEFDEKIFDAALADLTHAVAVAPGLYQAHYLRGNALMNSNDIDGAIAEYRHAISLEPKQPRTYFQYALALRAKQDGTGEEAVLVHLLAIDPEYAMAHAELGRMLLAREDLPQAVVQLKLAIKENPSSEQAYYLLSRAYDRLGDSESSTATAKLLISVRSANHQIGRRKDAPALEGSGATP